MWPDGRRVFAAGTFNTEVAHPVTALGPSHIEVSGNQGDNFILQRSVDLLHWSSILTNTFSSDTFDYVDADAVGSPWRFYRAVAAP